MKAMCLILYFEGEKKFRAGLSASPFKFNSGREVIRPWRVVGALPGDWPNGGRDPPVIDEKLP
jgi:hypothetical protein